MKKFGLCLALGLTACSADKQAGDSPYFKDDDILSISGRFLTKSGNALASRSIALRNLRRTAYYDPNATFFAEFESWLLTMAFPMFPSFEGSYEQKKILPNYFIKEARTATDGTFTFQMRGDQVLRDASGGINITLINDGDGTSDSYAKYNFVIKELDTVLDDIPQCDLGETRSETTDRVDFSWTLPAYTLDHYEFRFGDARDNSLLWVTHVESATTSLSLPKTIFMNSSIRYAVEIFYRFEDGLQMSCLTPSQTFDLQTPEENLAADKLATAENINFKITSLTNGRFKDAGYFQAFDTRSVVIDMGTQTLVHSINIHNLQFTSGENNRISLEGATADDPDDFQSLGLDSIDALRFASYDLASPGSWTKIRISSPAVFANLQEVTIQ